MKETTKEKIRKSRIGTTHSVETIQKISNTCKQRVFSKALRNRMTRGNIKANGKQVICVETGKVFESVSEASRYYNTAPICISRVCNDCTKTYKSKHFNFVRK